MRMRSMVCSWPWLQVELNTNKRSIRTPIFTGVYSVKGEKHAPIKVPVSVENEQLEMLLDTGASVSIIPESLYKKSFRDLPLMPSYEELKAYGGKSIPVRGQIKVNVKYEAQEKELPLIVVGNQGPPLLGRNRLESLRLNWKDIFQLSSPQGQNHLKGGSSANIL